MPGASELQLDGLLDALNLDSLRVLTPTATLDGPVTAVVVADAESLSTLPAGALALVPGLPASAHGIAAALAAAATAGAVGVALRESAWSAAGAGGGAAIGSGAPLPVIGVPDGLGWGELYEMLTSVLASASSGLIGRTQSQPVAALFSLADAVAMSLGGAVSIEDPQGRMLAYSNVAGQVIDDVREEVILARRVPLTEANRAEYLTLSRTTGPVRFTTEGLPRLAIAVRAGDQILGFLWVIDHDREPLADDAQRLDDAARMAAVALVRARAIDDVGRRTRDDALRQLLDGSREGGLRAAVGLPQDAAAGVLAVRRVGSAPGDDPAASWLANFIALSARVHFRDPHVTDVDDLVYMVVTTTPARLEELSGLAATIIERSTGREALQIGIGTVLRVDDLGEARRDADRVLSVLAARGRAPAFATLGEVRSLAVLTELAEVAARRPSLLRGAVTEMLDEQSDAPRWTVPTLRAYFDCLGNMNAAAARLDVHPNTFRYRLGRIVTRFGLDLDDPDDRLVLGLQLRLSQLADTMP